MSGTGRVSQSLRALVLAALLLAVAPGADTHASEAARKHEASATTSSAAMITRVVEGTFEDVLQDAEDAIIGQGLKITYRADVAGMLARTGRDLGFQPIYKGGQVLQFCSARLSYQAMKADAANIAFCPYGVFVFQKLDTPDRVIVGYRPLPVQRAASDESRKAMRAVNALLESIVREVAGE